MKKNLRFRLADALFLAMVFLPLAAAMALKIFTTPAQDGIHIAGARIFATISLPLQDLPITESQINSWLIVLSVFGLCLFLAHGLQTRNPGKRQRIAEWLVQSCEKLVRGNMGEAFLNFAPFIGAMMALSAFSSLSSLLGLFPPTSDFNVVAGWALLVFFLITFYKNKCGPIHYLKSFGEPVRFLLPLNVISEIATPVSMAFRHYGNVLSGMVISILVAAGLKGLSGLLFSWLPGVLGQIPFLQIGLPAVLSVYFDLFSGCLQAFIFAMLTMLYVATGFPAAEYAKRKAGKKRKKNWKMEESNK